MLKYFKTIAWTTVTLAFLLGAWDWTVSNGKSAIADIARKKGYCEDDACDRGIADVERTISERTQTNPMLIQWCFGVDEWAAANVRRGALIRSILVDLMYWPCGTLRGER
ncbi:hypothetical protein [Mesorhizobium sp. KR2-14]|uniref:hypothetical protein n=1 Tax=Mesorhizobium sp. KR2-14 TaxID=3156610 RepID=UPI0032B3A87D